MAFSVKILLDSMAPCGRRLTTWELTYPRFVHAEFMTHREFSRNAASSRAIPIEKMIQQVVQDPVLPVWWGKNQGGMQAREELDPKAADSAKFHWLYQRDQAVHTARILERIGLHKQITNRLLEPWMWITVIASSTNFHHWNGLRNHPDAQPEIHRLASLMWPVYQASVPQQLEAGDVHAPLIQPDEDFDKDTKMKVSVGRCARVSYLTHDGHRDPQKDIELHDRLVTSGHWSPFEHVALASSHDVRSGNFAGFVQYRKLFANEYTPYIEDAA